MQAKFHEILHRSSDWFGREENLTCSNVHAVRKLFSLSQLMMSNVRRGDDVISLSLQHVDEHNVQ